jgi:hypothetical protein
MGCNKAIKTAPDATDFTEKEINKKAAEACVCRTGSYS